MKYSFDTSALINPWYKLYPSDVFPKVWEYLSDTIDKDLVVAHITVIQEIEDEELKEWVIQRKKLEFQPDESIQKLASEIQSKFPKIVRPSAKVGADPFVIALAKQYELTVVSEEILKNSEKKDRGKIPYVCEKYGVKHINFLGFMREMQWTF